MADFNGNGQRADFAQRLAESARLAAWSRVASILGALITGPGMVVVGWFALTAIDQGRKLAEHEARLNQLAQRADMSDHRVDQIEARINNKFDQRQ